MGGGVLWSPYLIEAPNTVKYLLQAYFVLRPGTVGWLGSYEGRRERQESGTRPDHIPFFPTPRILVLFVAGKELKNVAETSEVKTGTSSYDMKSKS